MKNVIIPASELAEIQSVFKIAVAADVMDAEAAIVTHDIADGQIIIGYGEANRVLANLQGILMADLPDSLKNDFSFLGRVNQATNGLEGSIWESQSDLPDFDSSLN